MDNLSPLQLKHYSLIRLNVDLNPNYNAEFVEGVFYPTFDSVDLKQNVRVDDGKHTEDFYEFIITLNIACDYGAVESFPYKLDAGIWAVLHLDKDFDTEDPERLAVINGTSMVFGVLREQILSLTARFIYGPLMLPTVDFRGLAKAEKSRDDQPESSPTEQ